MLHQRFLASKILCALALVGCAAEGEVPLEPVLRSSSGLRLTASGEDVDGLPEEWTRYLGFDGITEGEAHDPLSWTDERLEAMSRIFSSGTYLRTLALYSLTLHGRENGRWFVLLEQPKSIQYHGMDWLVPWVFGAIV